MRILDWLVLALPLTVVAGIAFYTNRYLKSVADFMAGGRNAGRFLLCTSRSEIGAGAVAFVAYLEVFGKAGFTMQWWNQLQPPVILLVAISGFVHYRYRQTRSLTLAQFFEMRYSRRFRLFAGGLAFCAGLIHFGIVPVIGARFMVYFLGLPDHVHLFALQVPMFLILMAIFLGICTLMTTSGGQITVLVADCAEGMFSQIFYVIVALAVLITFFSWNQSCETLLARPPGESMVNPFDSFSLKDFNIWYVLMGLATYSYGIMAWQGQHAFNASAISPHESRMGNILGNWRGFAQWSMMILLAVCAATYLNHAEGAASVQAVLDKIPDPQTAKQLRMPVALSQILPVGIKGLLVSIILMGIFAGDGMQLHSWSSIFVQDVIMPLRKQPLTTRQHLRLLRLGVVGVAVFSFCFGTLFHQTEYVAMWFLVTMAIFTGGAGACIIGGLYWNRGTTAGAWTGLLTGSTLSVGGILLRQPAAPGVFQTVKDHVPDSFAWLASGITSVQAHLGAGFPLNGREISFFAAIAAVLSYVAVSLLTCRQPYDMDRLLHRGKYAVEPEGGRPADAKPAGRRFSLAGIIGIDEHFTRGDKWIAGGIFGWTMLWFLVFATVSIWCLIRPWPATAWAHYWLITTIIVPFVIGLFTTVWFTIGCWKDLRLFFRRLREETVSQEDDGTVAHGESAPAPPIQKNITVPPLHP